METVHSGKVLDQIESYSVIDCEVCGFKHLDPIPSNKELQDYYDKHYYQAAKPEYLEEDRLEAVHRNIFFDQRINFFLRNAPGKSILDIGCGDGLFLGRAKEKGFEVLGVEPSEQASALGIKNGIDIFYGTLDDFVVNNIRQFDIVHLKNVLEHVNEPIKVIELCYSLLVPGGIIYIEVPNDYEPMQRFGAWINKECKNWLCIPDHINYFRFSSAAKLLTRKKLQVLRRDTTFPMYFFQCIGLNFVKDRALGKKLHLWRVSMELFCFRNNLNGLRHIIYRLLAKFGLGRTVILYAKK